MAISKTEKHFIVKLKFRKKSDHSTWEIYASDKSFKKDYLYDNSPEIFGILHSMSGFGQSMGEVVSKNLSGSITLKATRGTTSFNKRIYDLLDDYILVNQSIVGYSFEKNRRVKGDIADLKVEFVGKVANYSIDSGSQTFTIEINPNDISTEIVNKRYSDLENITTESLGSGEYREVILGANNNFAPIIFGENLDIILEPLAKTLVPNANNIPFSKITYYGIASILASFQYQLDPSSYTVKNNFGELVSIPSPYAGSNVTSLLKGSDLFPTYISCYHAGHEDVLFVPLQKASTQNTIFHGLSLRCLGVNSTAVPIEGELRLKIVKATRDLTGLLVFTDVPNTSTVINKLNYEAEAQGSAEYFLEWYFTKPFIFKDEDNFYIRIEETGITTAAQIRFKLHANGLKSKPIYKYQQGAIDSKIQLYGIWTPSLGTSSPSSCLKTIMLSEDISNNKFLTLRASNALTSTPLNVKFFEDYESFLIEPLIYRTKGLLDDPSGTITGTPAQLIDSVFNIIKTLFYLQNGESLTGWDTSRFPDAEEKSVKVGGVSYSPITFRNLILEIAEAGSSAVIKNRDGTISFWTYLCSQTPRAIITERDCILSSIESLGIEGITNKFELSYLKKEKNYSISNTTPKYFDGYKNKENLDSQEIYGIITPEAVFQENNWINNDEAAERYCKYKIEQQSFERFRISISVPFWKANYRELELWDLVNFNHFDMPSKSGTLPPNQTKAVLDGVDFAMGDVLRYAKNYVCRIVERKPVYYTSSNEPYINFTLVTIGQNERF